jgi:hypothetical protein
MIIYITQWGRVVTRNWQHDRLTIEKLAADCLDVRELHRAGAFKDGWKNFPMACFRWPRIEKMSAAKFMVRIEHRNQITPQNIRVVWTWCNFGGARPWLICLCGRRVARLFKGLGGYYCRSCCGDPVYESQRRSKKARCYLQAYRLRQRLGGSRPVVDPVPARPYGMRRKTYARLCERIRRLEQPLVGSRVVRHAPLWFLPLSY